MQAMEYKPILSYIFLDCKREKPSFFVPPDERWILEILFAAIVLIQCVSLVEVKIP